MSELNERQWLVEHGKIQDGSKVLYLDERKTEVVKAYKFEIEGGSIVFKKMLAANMFTNVACFPSKGTIVRENETNKET
jgi:hypothetical protein